MSVITVLGKFKYAPAKPLRPVYSEMVHDEPYIRSTQNKVAVVIRARVRDSSKRLPQLHPRGALSLAPQVTMPTRGSTVSCSATERQATGLAHFGLQKSNIRRRPKTSGHHAVPAPRSPNVAPCQCHTSALHTGHHLPGHASRRRTTTVQA